jgi:hypothetical protein
MEDNDFSTYEGCLAAVQKHGWMIKYVPQLMITSELSLAAVHQTGMALGYMPDILITSELALAAVHQHGCALVYVPKKMRTLEICLAAVKQNGLAIKDVPTKIKNHELCIEAVKQDGMMLRYVPSPLQSDEIIAVVLRQPFGFQFIKKKMNHGVPKQMPPKAYDTLEMGYDEDTAIQDGELMVDFHNEFEYGRFYRKATFEKYIKPSMLNPTTRENIWNYTIYQAKV